MELPQSWKNQLMSEVEKSYFLTLMQCVEKAYASEDIQVFPSKELVFNAFGKCSFEATKVIVLGQDPYPTIGHANGLCFSVDPSLKKYPKSLINIFKELQLLKHYNTRRLSTSFSLSSAPFSPILYLCFNVII
jgi:uracil-DNA glycosylase